MPEPILPPLRRSAADAERFARIVHADQVDKAGRPYVEHLERVSERAQWLAGRVALMSQIAAPDIDTVAQIAWLHDTIEDTTTTSDGLEAEAFDPLVIDGVEAVTRGPREKDLSYVEWIKVIIEEASLPALIVKLADMEDNSDPDRLALLPAETRERLERKYAEPLKMLRAAVGRREGP